MAKRVVERRAGANGARFGAQGAAPRRDRCAPLGRERHLSRREHQRRPRDRDGALRRIEAAATGELAGPLERDPRVVESVRGVPSAAATGEVPMARADLVNRGPLARFVSGRASLVGGVALLRREGPRDRRERGGDEGGDEERSEHGENEPQPGGGEKGGG